MKTDKPSVAAGEKPVATEHPFGDLLRRNTGTTPAHADGVAIGRVDHVDEQGKPHVSIDTFGVRNIPARSLISVTPEHAGREVALGFESSDPRRPIILGWMLSASDHAAHSLPELRSEAGRLVIEAESELELRCGDAVILLEADGQLTIRGVSITSHASATQRIRGGSVQVN